jgi:hypothetical protein
MYIDTTDSYKSVTAVDWQIENLTFISPSRSETYVQLSAIRQSIIYTYIDTTLSYKPVS